jgi:2-keto-4-pentenoate hydratase/2-oxohepta-3-ene-1,7-dioic acid hydratase in catechol pathway
MKLLFFDGFKMGVLKDGNVVDVSSAVPNTDVVPPQDQMERVIEGFAGFKPRFEEIVAGSAGVPMASVRLRAPLPRPHTSLCAFSNYLDRNSDRTPGAIDFFYKGSTGPVGNGDTVEILDMGEGATAYQPEPEIGYVIGKPARYVKEADALDYVFGYVNFADVSARGPGVQQRRDHVPAQGTDDLVAHGAGDHDGGRGRRPAGPSRKAVAERGAASGLLDR